MAFSKACPLPDLGLANEEPVWRFMSLTKLLDLLISNSLYFTQIKILRENDPYEYEPWEFERKVAEYIDQDDEAAFRFTSVNDEVSLELKEKMIKNTRETFGMSGLRNRRGVWGRSMYVSCWHVSKDEPAGLWKQYSDEFEGVAIKSTIGGLRASLDAAPEELHLGVIKYDNPKTYNQYDLNLLFPAFRKRNNFKHENELRILFFDREQDFADSDKVYSPGIKIPFERAKLISKIVVGPKCEGWVLDTIEKTIHQICPELSVERSGLLNVPDY
ncbi:MAG: DUF2971 domain-containing protein [Hyphococcus sp.]|nr:MAG: DUF2971 domain-containing protein [Marinicaulis sp.]